MGGIRVAPAALLIVGLLAGCLGDGPTVQAPSDDASVPEDGNVTAPPVNDTLPPPPVPVGDPQFMTIDGSLLNYTVAMPNTTAEPRTLVLVAHGVRHDLDSWRHHLAEMASWGHVAAAIMYRDNYGFPILWGAQDLAAARDHLHATHGPFERTVLVGVSMGAAVSGTALAESSDLFDAWFAVEPVSAVYETWAEACAAGYGVAFAAEVCLDIEEDAGRTDDGQAGAPCGYHECRAAYERRSPVLRTDAMAYLTDAFVIHAAYDGLVPYDQGAQLAEALQDSGITTHFTTVLRGEEGTDSDTTPTSHALGSENQVDRTTGLAGHGTESDRDQAVIATFMEQLQAYLADGSVLHGPLVDRR